MKAGVPDASRTTSLVASCWLTPCMGATWPVLAVVSTSTSGCVGVFVVGVGVSPMHSIVMQCIEYNI